MSHDLHGGRRLAWRIGVATQFILLVALFSALLGAWFLGARAVDFRYVGF